MKLCLFLHLHQPPTQYPEIIKKVSEQSYQRIIAHLESFPRAKITLNITGSLAEQLAPNLVAGIKSLHERGQVELTQTAAYHPLLVFLPDDEVLRQIEINRQIIQKVFGFLPGPGFFAPEMAVDKRVLSLVKKSDSRWLLADEEAVTEPDPKRVVFSDGTGFTLVRRHRQLSIAVAFSQIRHVDKLLSVAAGQRLNLLILAMDGETFGHHRPEQLEFLKEFLALSGSGQELLTLSEMIQKVEAVPMPGFKASTWGESFDRWRNPNNPVHQLQWQLYESAIKAVWNSKESRTSDLEPSIFSPGDLEKSDLPEASRKWLQARQLLDRALHSDQFWWAAKNPCWHYPMLEKGARLLWESVQTLPGALDDKREVKSLYDRLTQMARDLYGNTIIAC